MENKKEFLQEQARNYLDSRSLLPKIPINTMDVEIDPTDRISQLPDEVLAHTVCFLSSQGKDRFHLSAVSRTWYRVVTLLSPIWNFIERTYDVNHSSQEKINRHGKFLTFVQNTLFKQCYHNKRVDVFRLKITMPFVDTVYSTSVLDDWIKLALNFFGVKALVLWFKDLGHDIYCLPQTIFSAKELKVLQLRGMNLPKMHNPINWPSLRELYLERANVDEELVESLIFSCPLIEKFRVVSCKGLKRIQLSGFTKLRKVEVYDSSGVIERIMIDALSLKYFLHWTGTKSGFQNLDLRACESLKELSLIVCFSWTDVSHVLPQNNTSLRKVTLGVPKCDFLKLRKFLGVLLQIEILELYINDDKVTFDRESLRESSIPPLCIVKQLRLNVTPSDNTRRSLRDILDGVLWVCHPKSMELTSRYVANNDLIKLLWGTLQHLPQPKCCEFSRVNCWLHDLKGVVIKVIEDNGSSKMLTCDASLLTSLPILEPNMQKISFSFMWSSN